MARRPILFSLKRSKLGTLQTMGTGGTAVVVGGVYLYKARAWLCMVGGNTGAEPSGSADQAMGVIYDDEVTPWQLALGTTRFIDITGDSAYGWDYAIGYLSTLFNPSNTSTSFATLRPNAGGNTVYFDHEDVVVTDGQTLHLGGLAMWSWYRSNQETFLALYPTMERTIGHPLPSDHRLYVSVDAGHPDMPTTKGATIRFLKATNNNPCYIGGYGTVVGMILRIESYCLFTGAERTVCHLWFEDCDFLVSDVLSTASVGRASGSVGSTSIVIDLMYRKSPMIFSGTGNYTINGRVVFEDTYLQRDSDTTTLILGSVYTSISFVAVDFSGMAGIAPYIRPGSTFMPMAEIRYDGCVGLQSHQLRLRANYGAAMYRVEVVGGEVDGVLDPKRYQLFTDLFELEEVGAPVAYPPTLSVNHRPVAFKIATNRYVDSTINFCVLHTYIVQADAGLYEVSVDVLVPDTVSVTADNLWVDVTSCGAVRGRVETTLRNPACLFVGEGVWEGTPPGYVPVRLLLPAMQEVSGDLVATLYTTIPSTVMYASSTANLSLVASYE